MERRKFLGWMSVGTLANSFPMVLAACSPSTDSATEESDSSGQTASTSGTNNEGEIGDVAQAGGFVAMGTEQELAEQGFLFSREQQVIVIPAQSGKAIAFNPTCNHQGCLVDWDKTKDQFICPCHDSIFEADGTLISGLATESLPSLEVLLQGGEILVKA